MSRLTDLTEALAAYRAWSAARSELSERESNGGEYPPAEEWESSDDEAVNLLHEIVAALGEES